MKLPAALALALLLTACGQTGPLKLPEPKPAVSAPADASEADAQKLQPDPAP